jgi:hypothetical protein
MSVIVSRPAHTWAASHRVLLALVAFAIALVATVVIVLMTSSGSRSIQAPDQGQSDTQNPVPTGAQNQGPAAPQPRCLQYMPVRPC